MEAARGRHGALPFALLCGLAAALALGFVAQTSGLGEAEAVRLDAADRLRGVADVLAPPGTFGSPTDLPLPALLAALAALLPVPDPLGARLGSILTLSAALGLLAFTLAGRLEAMESGARGAAIESGARGAAIESGARGAAIESGARGAASGRLAAASALICLLASPAALGLAVLVGPDPLVAALGLAALVACAAPPGPAAERLAGLAVALAPLVDAEGLLVAPPLLLLAAARRRWSLVVALVVGAGAGALLWGLLAGRATSGDFLGPPPELRTYFLGERYLGPAPAWRWLPTLLVASTPPGVLVALAVGLAGALRRARRGCDLTGWLLAATGGWAAATYLPGGPRGGDLVGQLPLLTALSATAGVGLADLLGGRGRALAWVALLLPATGLAAVLEAHPRPRCWRSPLVGGTAGAERLGLEPAPDLSVAARDVRLWLDARLPQGASLSSAGSAWAATHVRRGLLRPDLRAAGRGDFILVANRPSRVAGEALALVEAQVVHRVQAGPTTLLVVVQRGDGR